MKAFLFFMVTLAMATTSNRALAQIFDSQNACGIKFFNVGFPQDVKTVVKGDLAFLKGIAGETSTRLHKQFFGDTEGQAYCDFLKKRFTQVQYGDCGDLTVMACNLGGKLTISPGYTYWITHRGATGLVSNAVERASVLIHEARHSDDQSWPHVHCPKPFLDREGKPVIGMYQGKDLSGLYACDTQLLSSYGIQYIWLKNLELNCANCSPEEISQAKFLSGKILQRIVDPAVQDQLEEGSQ